MLLDTLPLFVTEAEHNYRGKGVSIFSRTHSDDGLAEAQRASAAVLGLVLRFVVAQGVVFKDDPAVLPSVDIVCPLEMQKGVTLVM